MPWVRVQEQRNFITLNTAQIGPYGYETTNLCNVGQGDVVQLYAVNYPYNSWDHEGIIVGKGSGCGTLSNTLVNAHNADRYHYPLAGTWATYSMRYIRITGYRSNLTSSFADVEPTHWAWEDIEGLYSSQITGGCAVSPLRYCPNNTVTRAEMAVFLLKGIHGYFYTPPNPGGSTGFNDVAPNHSAAAWIKQLAAEGITGGCATNYYCPDATTTHAQMSVFLLRSKYTSAYAPPAVGGDTGFYDVATNYWAAAWIKQLAAEDISNGAHTCTVGNYCPETAVTRAEMAGMLLRVFNP